MRLHIFQLDEKPGFGEYPDDPFVSIRDYGMGINPENIDSELPNQFEDLHFSSMENWPEEVNMLREAYEGKLFSFADDGGNWISVNEEQKQTAKEYWDELKQYPMPDMFQVITWRFSELYMNMDPDTLEGFFDIRTWQFVEWVSEIAEIGKRYHIIENLESHI